MNYTVIGGDMRFAYLSEMLAAEGHTVKTFGLEKAELSNTILSAPSIKEATEGAETVILPYPLMRSEGFLNSPLSREITDMAACFRQLPKETPIMLGGLTEKLTEQAQKEGLSVVDYSKREEYLLANGAITAQGAVKILLEELPVTLQEQNVLVTGYGRIGHLLAGMLRSLGAKVTICARRAETLAWAKAEGLEGSTMEQLKTIMPSMTAVVNTVPARIFGRDLWDTMKDLRLYLELASRPGGVDLTRLTEREIPAVCARGISGDVFPESAALALKKTVEQMIEERRNMNV